MSDRHETVLAEPQAEATEALARADRQPEGDRRAAVATVVAQHPTLIAGWASLAELTTDPVESYAYARTGYHRGLDALRGAGWGGRGYVRWSIPANRGALRCIAALRAAAEQIGETSEVERLHGFLRDLDPDWDDANVAS
ncbi:MAG: DUF3151 family protein [Nitriliruptoraceae bacterium]